MSLEKQYIRQFSYRIWWHLTSLEARKQATFISNDFYNEIKDEFPNKQIKEQSIQVTNVGLIPIVEFSGNTKIKIDIGPDELKIHYMGNVFEEEQLFLNQIINNRKKLFKVFEQLNIKHDHYHQDIFIGSVLNINSSNIQETLSKINFNYTAPFFPKDQALENLNLNFDYSNGNLGKIKYQLVSGVQNNKKSLVVQQHFVSNKPKTEVDCDNWVQRIIKQIKG